METNEPLNAVKNLIQIILKAKKISKMYPQNNPIYLKTFQAVEEKFGAFFSFSDTLQLHFSKNDVFYDSQSVYHNPEKQDNFALLFFKDGIRDLSFRSGVKLEELEEFIKITSLDFEREVVDDDIVTLLWEKNFQHIEYVVDDAFLSDGDDYETKAINELQQKSRKQDYQQPVYENLCGKEEALRDTPLLPVTDEDYTQLSDEFKEYSRDKTGKFFTILFELLFNAEKEEEYRDVAGYFTGAIEYSAGNGNLPAVTEVQSKLIKVIGDVKSDERVKECAIKLLSFTGSPALIALIGNTIDGPYEIEEDVFKKYVTHLNSEAVPHFIKILGELNTIRARKLFIDALVYMCGEKVSLLFEHLNDARWYVVRNIVHILSKIGDKKAVNHLLITLRHRDIRVKKEVLRALGQLKEDKALKALQDCCRDENPKIRKYALSAVGSIGSEAAKQIIIEEIGGKGFRDKPFKDKKEYFEVLSRWNDSEVYDFLVRIMKKRSIFGRTKALELKACAAYSLGMMGRSEALPILKTYKTTSNRLLREFSFTALKRIENGT